MTMTMTRQGTQEGLRSAASAVAPSLMKNHGSSHKIMAAQKLQSSGEHCAESTSRKSFDTSSRDLRSRSSAALGGTAKRPSHAGSQQNTSATQLREPTKF